MTYYFMREIWLLSKVVWDLTMNKVGVSALQFFLGEANGIPGAEKAYKEALADSITQMEIQTTANPHVAFQIRDETKHNIELKRAILGWVTNRITAPTPDADCHNEYPKRIYTYQIWYTDIPRLK